MAQSLHIGLYPGPFTNLPFGICAIYFDLLNKTDEQKPPNVKGTPRFTHVYI